MADNHIFQALMIDEHEAQGEVAAWFDEVKRELQTPFVPNFAKVLAVSPAAAKIYWAMVSARAQHTTLPESLMSMIGYTIAYRNECQYCTSINELTCRTLGVDEDNLVSMAENLDNVNPERIRAILEFALTVARSPKSLGEADFERLREQGVTDAEIIEIALNAAICALNDILSDTLKIPVEESVRQALGN